MKNLSIIFLGFFSAITIQAHGQNLLDKINKASKKVDDALKGNFPATQQSHQNSSSATPVSGKKNQVLLGTGTSPGDISPNAVYVDADRFSEYFANGTAAVYKGSSFALIDATGKFIVPYNKLKYLNTGMAEKGPRHYCYEIIQAQEAQETYGNNVFLNNKGNIIAKNDMAHDLSYKMSDDGRLLCEFKGNHTVRQRYVVTCITPDGRRYLQSASAASNDIEFDGEIVHGIGIVHDKDNTKPHYQAYKKISGAMLTDYNFDEAYPFSEGMAIVGRRNEYGEMKYGYIDTFGKMAVPYTFSERPGNFTGGFARVVPKDKGEFEYGFIDRHGRLVCKQTHADVAQYGNFDHFTPYGLAFSSNWYVMDTTFKIISRGDFFRSFGLPEQSWWVVVTDRAWPPYVEGEKNPKLYFTSQDVKNPLAPTGYAAGFINLATRKVVSPVFYQYKYFDPVSHLAYARVFIGRDEKGVLMTREGFINEDGVFVILKKKASTW